MKNKFKIYKDKIIRMIDFIKLEYSNIILEYSEDKIIQKSLPLKATEKLEEKQKDIINKFLYSVFSPSLEKMSEMIDSGIIEWSEIAKDVEIEDVANNKELIIEFFYQSHEKLYIYKQIKYNLTFDFLMQMYLFFEKEMVIFLESNFKDLTKCSNIFTVIQILEHELGYEIDTEIKKGIDLYRKIINVYKHGYGESFISIANSNPEILNFTEKDKDMSFVFKLDKINIEELYKYIVDFLENICF